MTRTKQNEFIIDLLKQMSNIQFDQHCNQTINNTLQPAEIQAINEVEEKALKNENKS